MAKLCMDDPSRLQLKNTMTILIWNSMIALGIIKWHHRWRVANESYEINHAIKSNSIGRKTNEAKEKAELKNF